jgi:capsid portal protein
MVETLIKVWTDTLVLGNGYLEIGRQRNGKVGYVGHIPGHLMRFRKARDGFVQSANQTNIFFRNLGDAETPDPINDDDSPNEVINFKMYSPRNSYYGVPPSVSALSALVGDKFAQEYNIDYFEGVQIIREKQKRIN